MKTIEEIEQLFITACDKAIAEGWKIEAGGFANPDNRTCCPIAAFVGKTTLISFTTAACEMLDLDPMQVEHFWYGFDNITGEGDPNNPFYKLGQKLRAKYITQ